MACLPDYHFVFKWYQQSFCLIIIYLLNLNLKSPFLMINSKARVESKLHKNKVNSQNHPYL